MQNKSLLYILLITFISCITIYPSIAQDNNVYEVEWKKEAILLGSGIALSLLGEELNRNNEAVTLNDLANLDRANLPSIDRGTTNNFSSSANTFSDVVLYTGLALPLGIYTFNKCPGQELEALVMTVETFLITQGTTQIIKAVARRFRPFNYNPDVPLELKLSRSSRKSFLSGHTSSTAAFSFMTAKILTDIHPNWSKRTKRIIWTTSALLPAAAAYGRVKAGKHFPTDVIAGYLLGTSIGLAIPALHKNEKINLEAGLGAVRLTYNLD